MARWALRRSARAAIAALAVAAAQMVSTNARAESLTSHQWSGFYAGVNAGYASHDASAILTGDNPVGGGTLILNRAAGEIGNEYVPRSLSLSSEGRIGGVQLGFANRLTPSFVLGLEADFQFADADDQASMIGVSTFGNPLTLTVGQHLEWFGTLRGRLGYLVNDNLLIFGSAGLALGKTSSDATVDLGGTVGNWSFIGGASTFVCVFGTTCLAGSSSGTSAGWVIGGGFELALTNTISLKAEYLRLDFGSDTVRMTTVAPSAGDAFIDVKVKHTYDIARVGLNFRF